MTGPTSISAVPLDYFMNGVQPEPQNAQQPAAPVPDGRDAPRGAPAGQPRAAGGLIGKLDVLLTQAAKASTKSLDGKTVKSALQKLVDDGALDKKSLKLLARTADRAKDALKALNAFTGRDLAAAFGADDRINAESPAGKALDAITAQNDLSEMLSNLDKGLDSIARHADQMLARNRKFRGVDEALQNEVAEMRLLCDRRATEISRLAYQMKAFALNQAAPGENADPNITAILNAKVKELLPREALAMHGTADALSRLNEQVTAQLRPLAERIESFRHDPAATLDGEAETALANDISTVKNPRLKSQALS